MTCYFFRLCWTEAYFTQFLLLRFVWFVFPLTNFSSVNILVNAWVYFYAVIYFIFGGHTISEKYFKLELNFSNQLILLFQVNPVLRSIVWWYLCPTRTLPPSTGRPTIALTWLGSFPFATILTLLLTQPFKPVKVRVEDIFIFVLCLHLLQC